MTLTIQMGLDLSPVPACLTLTLGSRMGVERRQDAVAVWICIPRGVELGIHILTMWYETAAERVSASGAVIFLFLFFFFSPCLIHFLSPL